MAKDLDASRDVILSDSMNEIFSKNRDHCNLTLIDSAFSLFIRIGSAKSFEIINSLANHSDGYLSEYYVEKLSDILRNRFPIFFEYIYNETRTGKKSKLPTFLIECWSNIASLSNSPEKEIKKIKTETTRQVLSLHNDLQCKKKYLDSLLQKIDPNYLN